MHIYLFNKHQSEMQKLYIYINISELLLVNIILHLSSINTIEK